MADQEFHLALIKASHNEYMRRLYPIINSAVNEIMQISQSRKMMQDIALQDNRLILEFLLARDSDGASYAMSIHMKHLIQTLDLAFRRPSPLLHPKIAFKAEMRPFQPPPDPSARGPRHILSDIVTRCLLFTSDVFG